MESESAQSPDRSDNFTLNVKIGSGTYLVKAGLKNTTSIQSLRTSLNGYAVRHGLDKNWELIHEGRRLPTTTWSCGIVVADEDVTEGVVWKINMQTPLNEFFARCVSRYQGNSKLSDKTEVLLYDELCVNIALLDNSDGKPIPVEEGIAERTHSAVHLYAAPRSNNFRLLISEGKYQGLGSQMNNRVNVYKYTAKLDDQEIIPVNEHTVKSATDIELANPQEQQVRLEVHPPKPTFFLKSPFRALDDSKTPYALGFNAGDVIFLQSKRIMRAKAKVQDFHIEPGATIYVVKTILITIEEISTKRRQLQLQIPEAQWLVSDLKFALFEHTSVLPSSIVLRKDGLEMHNDDFVSQYEVVQDSVIFMELLDKPIVDERNPQTIIVHFSKLPSKSPLRLHSSSRHKPVVVDIDSDDESKNRSVKGSSNNSTASKNLKRKLDFDKNDDKNEPPKKKVLWKNSISSDSASEGEKGRNNVHNVEDGSNNSDDEDFSGVNEEYNHNNNDEESSEDDSEESGSPKWRTNNSNTNNNNATTKKNHTNGNGYKLQTNEKPKQKPFQQRTDKSRLTHSAIITQMKQFPNGAQIKDIQGVSIWENQMIYFILMSTNDGLRSAWIASELLSDLSPKVLITYLERKMQFRK